MRLTSALFTLLFSVAISNQARANEQQLFAKCFWETASELGAADAYSKALTDVESLDMEDVFSKIMPLVNIVYPKCLGVSMEEVKAGEKDKYAWMDPLLRSTIPIVDKEGSTPASSEEFVKTLPPEDQANMEIAETCVSAKNDFEKTKCVSRAYQKHGVDYPITVHSEWFVYTEIDPMTDETTVVVSTKDPEVPLAGASFRCMRNLAEFFIEWPSNKSVPPRSQPVDIRTRVDKNAPRSSTWRMADESRNVSFYNGDVEKLAEEIIKGERIIAEVSPGTGTDILQFSLDGLDEAIDPLRKSCRW